MKKKNSIKIFLALVVIVVVSLTSFVYIQKSNKKNVIKPKTVIKNTPKEKPKEVEISSEEKILKSMTLEEKVGQLFLARVPYKDEIKDIKKYHLGGYLFFGKDMKGQTKNSIKNIVKSYQDASKIKMLIGSDEEGGTVSRLSEILETRFKSPKQLFNEGGLEAIRKDTKSKASILTNLGFKAPLYPVSDLATSQDGFMYWRALGSNVKQTSDYVKTVVKQLKKSNVMSTLKHFPGYGNQGDSHTQIITDNRDYKTIKNNDLKVFKAGIDAGADSILVAHNIIKSIDSKLPASISPKVHKIIRNDLHFDGVVMTDDLDMKGIANFTNQLNAGLMSIKSGNDLILSSTYAKQIPYIVKKVQNKEVDEKMINEHVLRILKLKSKLKIIDNNQN